MVSFSLYVSKSWFAVDKIVEMQIDVLDRLVQKQ
jgi:hypothetical protein